VRLSSTVCRPTLPLGGRPTVTGHDDCSRWDSTQVALAHDLFPKRGECSARHLERTTPRGIPMIVRQSTHPRTKVTEGQPPSRENEPEQRCR